MYATMALALLVQAIYAAVDDEAVRADAFCQRAELRVQLEQWQEWAKWASNTGLRGHERVIA